MIKIVNLSFIFKISFLAVDELAIASSSYTADFNFSTLGYANVRYRNTPPALSRTPPDALGSQRTPTGGFHTTSFSLGASLSL